MTPIPDSTLEARIKRLEQQNRRTKAGALVLLALLYNSGLLGIGM
jgi:hypothetical protein